MPLPAWRALLFAALVDDPADDEKRAYLLDVIKRLVINGADLPDNATLKEAREIIEAQFPEGVPTVMDPFCGGGSTLVEAQRLGLPTFGSDLNPVAVLIARTLTQLLPKMFGEPSLHPEKGPTSRRHPTHAAATEDLALIPADMGITGYDGLTGVVRDVTYYAERIRHEAWNRLQAFYPSQPGETPVAWLWARTAPCPNPACGVETVLTTSLDFRGYAAADAQARWTALICSGVALPGRSGRNWAAMMVRRSLASMSWKDGSVLVVYQGWRARRSVTSSG
jgi:putative DNA methylase